MAKKVKTRKKILITSLLLGILLIGSVLSIVFVLAAASQEAEVNISVRYVVDGVGARVSASYATVSIDETVEVTKVSMTEQNSNSTEIEFEHSDKESTKKLIPGMDVVLTSLMPRVVYEYSFTNMTNNPFSITFTNYQLVFENIKFTYLVSKESLKGDDLRSENFTDSLGVQTISEKNRSLYIYVCAEIDDVNDPALFEGEFVWSLLKAEDSSIRNINLNQNGGTGGSSSIKTIYSNYGIFMPAVYEIPTKANYMFAGYYSNVNDESAKYIDYNGLGVKVADLSNNSTLTAKWVDAFSISGTTLTNLTSEGKNLSIISVPEGVETIAANSFAGATASTVIIPNSVKAIGESAFENNVNLEKIIIKTDNAETIAYADGVGLETIGSKAFKGCYRLKKLTIPTSVISIADESLAGCSNLKRLEMPNILGEGYYVEGYSALSKLFSETDNYSNNNIPSSLEIVVLTTGTIINEAMFFGCENLRSVVIPNTIEVIKMDAFQASGIEKFDIPRSVTTIESYSFKQCKRLQSIFIPNTITSLGGQIFRDCINLLTATFEEGYQLDYIPDATFNNSGLIYIEIPEGVKALWPYAFENCDSLIYVSFPMSFIDNETYWAFGNNYNICQIENYSNIDVKELIARGDWEWTNMDSCQVKTDNSKFSSYYEIGEKYVTLTKGNEKILIRPVDKNLTVANDIPNDITKISEWAFYGCGNLISVVIPNSVTYIGDYAFCGCTLTSVTIPNSITSIGKYAFSDCTSLTSITIPSSVTYIGDYAFYKCTGLTDVVFENQNDWFICTSNTATSGTKIEDLSNSKTNAEKLKTNSFRDGWLDRYLKKFDIF